ncbi:MAG: DNA-directed RNA polymerase subunit L [Candidatus Aenigmarchaeota archaeon]|nr:DNA-directed RNA polymerase subunit L [Candidatus Aenigmarchaeota archaeon]
MEIKIVGKGKNKLRIEFEDEGHTFLNLLRKSLWDQKVDYAAYEKIHPFLGKPILIVETKKKDPTNALKAATREIANEAKEFRDEFIRALKK